MKFRKKPVVIEAEQWFSTLPCKVVEGKFGYWMVWESGVYEENEAYMYEQGARYIVPYKGKIVIDTLEGKHEVSEGDWIITGVKGEKYPVKPDIFEMTYEKL